MITFVTSSLFVCFWNSTATHFFDNFHHHKAHHKTLFNNYPPFNTFLSLFLLYYHCYYYYFANLQKHVTYLSFKTTSQRSNYFSGQFIKIVMICSFPLRISMWCASFITWYISFQTNCIILFAHSWCECHVLICVMIVSFA